MANIRKIELEHVKDGDIIYVTACSQCASTATISLDGKLTESVQLSKETGSCDLLPLKGNYKAQKQGNDPLFLVIDIKNNSQMKVIKNAIIMSDLEGKEKGLNFTFNIEDAVDNDFNDYYVNIVVWHHRG